MNYEHIRRLDWLIVLACALLVTLGTLSRPKLPPVRTARHMRTILVSLAVVAVTAVALLATGSRWSPEQRMPSAIGAEQVPAPPGADVAFALTAIGPEGSGTHPTRRLHRLRRHRSPGPCPTRLSRRGRHGGSGRRCCVVLDPGAASRCCASAPCAWLAHPQGRPGQAHPARPGLRRARPGRHPGRVVRRDEHSPPAQSGPWLAGEQHRPSRDDQHHRRCSATCSGRCVHAVSPPALIGHRQHGDLGDDSGRDPRLPPGSCRCSPGCCREPARRSAVGSAVPHSSSPPSYRASPALLGRCSCRNASTPQSAPVGSWRCWVPARWARPCCSVINAALLGVRRAELSLLGSVVGSLSRLVTIAAIADPGSGRRRWRCHGRSHDSRGVGGLSHDLLRPVRMVARPCDARFPLPPRPDLVVPRCGAQWAGTTSPCSPSGCPALAMPILASALFPPAQVGYAGHGGDDQRALSSRWPPPVSNALLADCADDPERLRAQARRASRLIGALLFAPVVITCLLASKVLGLFGRRLRRLQHPAHPAACCPPSPTR